MSQTVSESATEIIAEMLKNSKTIEQPPVLFLGSRSGLFYGHTGLYNDVKHYSSQDFDALSDPMKIQECFKILEMKILEMERFNEHEIYLLLKKCIPPDKNKIPVRTEDRYMANLILNDYFDLIISTTIDPLLEEALYQQRILYLDSQTQQNTNSYDVLIQGYDNQEQILGKRGAKRKKVIKIFGDLRSREYYTVQNELPIDDEKNKDLKTFLMDTLSETVVIIGFDPYWDRSLANVFRNSGKDIYFISEDLPPENNPMMTVLKRRSKGKHFNEESYSYRTVVKELHEKLFLGGLPGSDHLRRVAVQLQMIQSSVDELHQDMRDVREAVDQLVRKQNPAKGNTVEEENDE